MPKPVFKKKVKLLVTDFWHGQLATECLALQSLKHFDPCKSSLLVPHPMWTTSAGNSYECNKSTTLARMTSGRYRSEMMCRFWSSNQKGYCLATTCYQVEGDLEHLLVVCPALEVVRQGLRRLWCTETVRFPSLHQLIVKTLSSPASDQAKFILDSTASPDVIKLVQMQGQPILDIVLYLTRTWAYSVHRKKMILTGKWPAKVSPKPAHVSDYPILPVNITLTDQHTPTDQHALDNYINNEQISSTIYDYSNAVFFTGYVHPQCADVPQCSSSSPGPDQSSQSAMLPRPVPASEGLHLPLQCSTQVFRPSAGCYGGGDGVALATPLQYIGGHYQHHSAISHGHVSPTTCQSSAGSLDLEYRYFR